MREWRCFPERDLRPGDAANSWAGSPGNAGLGTFWSFRAVVAGRVGAQTGYICSIHDVDRLLREGAAPVLKRWLAQPGHSAVSLAEAMLAAFEDVSRRCPGGSSLDALELQLNPHLRLMVCQKEADMVQFTQSFEFAASHRLSCSAWTEQENRRVFGKCANAHGHGHNYVVEITVKGRPDEQAGSVADLEHMQRVVRDRVIEPFDHKYLNVECADFAQLNPSVENIALVIWQRLSGAFERCRLARVRVWETPKTYAEYDGTEQ